MKGAVIWLLLAVLTLILAFEKSSYFTATTSTTAAFTYIHTLLTPGTPLRFLEVSPTTVSIHLYLISSPTPVDSGWTDFAWVIDPGCPTCKVVRFTCWTRASQGWWNGVKLAPFAGEHLLPCLVHSGGKTSTIVQQYNKSLNEQKPIIAYFVGCAG